MKQGGTQGCANPSHYHCNTNESLGTEHSKTCPRPISWAVISGLAASGGMQRKGQSASHPFLPPANANPIPALHVPAASLKLKHPTSTEKADEPFIK